MYKKTNCSPLIQGCCCEGCIAEHRKNECSYGNPCGPDDYVNECDCDKEEQ